MDSVVIQRNFKVALTWSGLNRGVTVAVVAHGSVFYECDSVSM